MTNAIGPAAALPAPRLADAIESQTTVLPAQTTAQSPTPGLTGGNIVADSTISALLAEQAPTPLDLRGLDLRAADLKGLDLRGADLRGANLAGMNLSGLDLTNADLSDADLTGALLEDTKLANVRAERADLSNAVIINANLNGGDFSGARFDGAYFGPVGPADPAPGGAMFRLTAVILDGASLTGATFRMTQVEKSSAVEATFANIVGEALSFDLSNLRGASFAGATGSAVHFSYSDLSGAAITQARTERLSFSGSTLEATRFAGSSLKRATFEHLDLSKADFAGVVRDGAFATFNSVKLDGLDFSGFNFYGAAFKADPLSLGSLASERTPAEGRGASYRGANFQGANFAYAQLASGALDGASRAGATFERALAEGPADASLAEDRAGWSIEEYLLLRAERLGGEIDFDQLAVQAERWREREAEAAQLARPASDEPSTLAALEPADAPKLAGSSKQQAASAAISTLKAVHERMREAFDLAARSSPGYRMPAAPTTA